ncbi:hypothetical protein BGW36DRAFT_199942 [Talaromyces proteolyticus]|uniref:MARVEL domain-containing protein n=1 Tax=Talaromyces proteolyticus TaxID=1131652 RepID=A0AAD4KN08_9EURO|nr:uncharacterized protein BGW36DRAFT_199942 [Talaromyces proteolyticus]KAH8695296.1 hypothetical protein BGW36DRAFT_199942 [Talaromyces proteolyticus]
MSTELIPRPVAIALRFAQVAFAAIVAGLIGYFLNVLGGDGDSWTTGRWIYAEVVAGASIVLGCILMIPSFHGCFVWPVDITLGLAWLAAFGNLVNTLDGTVCGQIDDISNFSNTNANCAQGQAGEAFAFLSGIAWLVTGILGIYYVWRSDQQRLGYWAKHYEV